MRDFKEHFKEGEAITKEDHYIIFALLSISTKPCTYKPFLAPQLQTHMYVGCLANQDRSETEKIRFHFKGKEISFLQDATVNLATTETRKPNATELRVLLSYQRSSLTRVHPWLKNKIVRWQIHAKIQVCNTFLPNMIYSGKLITDYCADKCLH